MGFEADGSVSMMGLPVPTGRPDGPGNDNRIWGGGVPEPIVAGSGPFAPACNFPALYLAFPWESP